MREALGRSRGGYGTKACVITDGAGRAISFARRPVRLMNFPWPRIWSIACPSSRLGRRRQRLCVARVPPVHLGPGRRPAIPTKKNEAPVACPGWIYNNRNRVERLWARLKEWRAVATRYEKTARSFMGVLCLAATFDWIKKDFKL